MRSMFLIARREYLEQVRGRAFRMTTLGLPLVFAIIIGVFYLASMGLGSGKHLAVASDNAALANDIRTRLLSDKSAKAIVDVISPATPADRDALLARVRTRDLDGLLWIDSPQGVVPEATYYSQSSGDFIGIARFNDALN